MEPLASHRFTLPKVYDKLSCRKPTPVCARRERRGRDAVLLPEETLNEFPLSGKSLKESEKSGAVHKTLTHSLTSSPATHVARATLNHGREPAPLAPLSLCSQPFSH